MRFALLVLVLVAGCTGSIVQRQTTAISVLADLTSAAADEAADHARIERDAQCPHQDGGPRDPACIARLHEHWDPADEVIDGVHLALDAWTVAAAPETTESLRNAVHAAVQAYRHAREVLAPYGVTLPDLPLEVEQVILAVLGGA